MNGVSARQSSLESQYRIPSSLQIVASNNNLGRTVYHLSPETIFALKKFPSSLLFRTGSSRRPLTSIAIQRSRNTCNKFVPRCLATTDFTGNADTKFFYSTTVMAKKRKHDDSGSATDAAAAKTEDNNGTTSITEGSTVMIFPADQESAVFYNPVQVQNRDLSILMNLMLHLTIHLIVVH